MSNIQTAIITGGLCMKLHPEALNELEAVDLERSEVYKLIQVKLNANIHAADDIEYYFKLGIVYQILLYKTAKENLK